MTMPQSVANGRGTLEVSETIRETFNILGRRGAWIVPLSVLLVGAPTFLVLYVINDVTGNGLNLFLTSQYYGAWLLQILALGLTKVAVVAVVEADRRGEAPTAETVLGALARFGLPGMAAELIFTLGFSLGLVLLIVPGVIAMLAWYVCLPVLIIERSGVRGAFARSADLTRGRRWQLFGVTFVIGILIGLIGVAATLVMKLIDAPLVSLSIRALIGGLTQSFSLTAIVVIYWRLRRLREGLEEDRVATVFS